MSLEKLKEFSEARFVKLQSNGHSKKGRLTSPPYFKVSHILTTSDSPEHAEGSWWIDVDGDSRSLLDYNVVPNGYNHHSMTVIKDFS